MQGLQMGTPGVGPTTSRARDLSTDNAIVASSVEKLKATLMARAASAGIGVYESFGGYVVGNGVQREVPDLRALRRCLNALGVSQ